jgi:hypothetical protein
MLGGQSMRNETNFQMLKTAGGRRTTTFLRKTFFAVTFE